MTEAFPEFVGWAAPQESSEVMAPRGPIFDADVLAETARVHEAAGFDRVLIGYFTNAPDGFLVAAHVAATTERLGLLLAHRPGFVAPTLAARKLATLDQLSKGRAAVHIISGGSDADQAKDGDFADHGVRYRRSAEYVRVLRQTWTARQPFDHAGEFYRVDGALSDLTSWSGGEIPVYGGGGSDDAIETLAPVIDTFMLWGEPLADTAAFMERVRAVAAPAGNEIGFSVSTRPIIAETEGQAWDKARGYLDTILATSRRPGPDVGTRTSARSACSTSPHGTRCSTAACGPRWPLPPAPAATRRRSSGRPTRWPRRSPTTSTSAPPRCSSAATSRSPTPPPTDAS